ncbi:MAG: lytic transglycosylase, partial [Bacteroides sp.]|nr:lytic transglycosylase [Bacteroides sp.]
MNNIIKYIGTAALCISATVINAQDITYRTEKNEEIVMPACSKYNVDSLLAKWHSYKYLTEDSNCPESENIPYYSDSVYIDRLSKLTTSIEMPYNDVVKGYIELYSVKLRKQVS